MQSEPAISDHEKPFIISEGPISIIIGFERSH